MRWDDEQRMGDTATTGLFTDGTYGTHGTNVWPPQLMIDREHH
jgi:hypothetical protein